MKINCELFVNKEETKKIVSATKAYMYEQIGKRAKENAHRSLSILFNSRLNELEERLKVLERGAKNESQMRIV